MKEKRTDKAMAKWHMKNVKVVECAYKNGHPGCSGCPEYDNCETRLEMEAARKEIFLALGVSEERYRSWQEKGNG